MAASDDDLWGSLGYTPPDTAQPKPAADAASLSRLLKLDPHDAAVRTVLAEEKDPKARQWVAGVIANRAKGAGGDLLKVLSAPSQFQPWGTDEGRAKLLAIDPNSDDYKQTAAAVAPILAGQQDPSGGATHFYAPQSMPGGAKAEFDDGSGVKVGDTLFFGGQGHAPAQGGSAPQSDDLWGSLGYTPPAGDDAAAPAAEASPEPQDQPPPDGTAPLQFSGTGQHATPEQFALWQAMNKGGYWNQKDDIGTATNPYFQQPGASLVDTPAGAYVVDQHGDMIHNVPDEQKAHGFRHGFAQGAYDTGLSVLNLLPGGDDSTIKNLLVGHRAIYNADNAGDPLSGAGRFTGQLVSSLIPMAGVEGLALPALEKLGPVGAFLAGQGGKTVANPVLRLGARGLSLSAKGAQEGALAGVLQSSSDPNTSLGQQALEGAEGGAVFGPLIHGGAALGGGAARAAGGFIEPFMPGGADRAAIRQIQRTEGLATSLAPDASAYVDGSAPTYGEARNNPALVMLERSLRENPNTAQSFAEHDARNNAARLGVVQEHQADATTVADLARERANLIDSHKTALFNGAGEANTAPVVAAIDAAAGSPEAHTPQVATHLGKLREALVTEPPADLTPEEKAAWSQQLAQTGWGGEGLNPEAMAEAQARLGQVFQNTQQATQLPWDDELRQRIGEAMHTASQIVPDSQMPPLFRQLDDIASTAKDGENVSGASYQQLTHSKSPLTLLSKQGDAVGEAARNIRDALDDGLDRHLEANPPPDGEPDPLAALREARLQYKNLKTVEKLLPNSGPDQYVSPERLLPALRRSFSSSARTGAGPLGDLAEQAIRDKAARQPSLETDPRQLLSLREGLHAAIDKLQGGGETDDAARAAAGRLTGVRDALDHALTESVPGYGPFREAADRSAENVDALRYLQGLRLSTNGPNGGNVTLNLVKTALSNIERGQSMPGPHPAKGVSEATVHHLQLLQADLEREANRNNGKAAGSPTDQNRTIKEEFTALGTPLIVAKQAAGILPSFLGRHVSSSLDQIEAATRQRVMRAMANRLVRPDPLPSSVIRHPPSRVYQHLRSLAGGVPGALGGLVAVSKAGE